MYSNIFSLKVRTRINFSEISNCMANIIDFLHLFDDLGLEFHVLDEYLKFYSQKFSDSFVNNRETKN